MVLRPRLYTQCCEAGMAADSPWAEAEQAEPAICMPHQEICILPLLEWLLGPTFVLLQGCWHMCDWHLVHPRCWSSFWREAQACKDSASHMPGL